MLHIRIGAVLFLAAGACNVALGQEDTDAFNVDLAECIGLESEAARFACYEDSVNAARARTDSAADDHTESQAAEPAPRSGGTTAEPAASAPAEIAVAESAAANAAAERPAAERAPAERAAVVEDTASAADSARSDEPGRHEILATITQLRERAPDRWVITLDNGQVWQMNRSERYPLRVGLDVRLYETNWGPSYRLSALEHGGFVTVRRVN